MEQSGFKNVLLSYIQINKKNKNNNKIKNNNNKIKNNMINNEMSKNKK